MAEGPMAGIERLLAGRARALSGGALHPLQVRESVERAALASVHDGLIANRFSIEMPEADYASYEPALAELRTVLDEMLDDMEDRNGYQRVGDRLLEVVAGDVTPGHVTVNATFADTMHRDVLQPAMQASQKTRRITRQNGKKLVLGDGTRIRLTHTPFTIGRAPGNDLVVVGLAVSRHHAEIEAANGAFVVRDLGSRNGLLVDGVRVESAALNDRRPVVIGDVPLWLVEED